MEPDVRGVPDRSGRCPHYVTMRLTDALPRPVMQAWHDDIDRRMHMLSEMKGRALAIEEERSLVQRAIGKIERYLDSGHGSCILTDERAAGLVETVLWSGDGERYRLHAWSVMPNHVHALVTPFGEQTIEGIVHDWKAESTRNVNHELRRAGGLWHPNVIDYEVEHPAELARLRNMISHNPEQAGLHEWPFAGEEGRAAAPKPMASV